jgi:ribose/xylose/arabinose/galactoside ABC-type transport system permease subunit
VIAVEVSAGSKQAAERALRTRRILSWAWTVLGPFIGLVMVTAMFAFLTRESGNFLTVYNWRTIGVQTVIVGTAALGMTMIIIAGGIDLSAGSTVALVTVVIAMLTKWLSTELPDSLQGMKLALPLAMLAGGCVGALCGAINGALISALRVVPFIVTLGSYKIFRGMAKWLSSSTTVYLGGDVKPWWFSRIMATEPEPRWLIVAPGVWVLLALSLVLGFTLRRSLLGRYMYALGSNESTARLCGINVPAIKIVVYALGGLAFGLAGVLQFAYLGGVGDPTTADGMELQVIAAVVIGGGSLSGGEGTVIGTLIGCMIMSVLNNGCVHAGIPNPSQDILIGLIIVAAVAIDRLRRTRTG